jgi:hypothetical protein
MEDLWLNQPPSIVHISPVRGISPSQPIVTIFGKFGGLADIIKYAKLHNDRSRGLILLGGCLKIMCFHRKAKPSKIM